MKPFLKWVGSKRKLLPQLIPLLPDLEEIHTYIEPFLGSGALFFALEFDEGDRIVLGDQNAALIDVYRCVRDYPQMVLKFLEPLALAHSVAGEKHYKLTREQWNLGFGSPVERAAMFLYLNRTCFNGVWRVNANGKFNVPIGDYENPVIYNPELIQSASACLAGVELAQADFVLTVMAELKADEAFVYLDPPYVPVSVTANFTSYTADKFDVGDLERLEYVCRRIDAYSGKFMLSNSDAPLVRETFKAFNITAITRSGSLNSDIKKRGAVNELVIRNYE